MKSRCVNLFHAEPCNWGPIWSITEWRRFKRWARNLDNNGLHPFTPTEIGFNYNEYLKMGKDVQSPWVWRYNWECHVQLRYTMTCFGGPHTQSYHMAVNHREQEQLSFSCRSRLPQLCFISLAMARCSTQPDLNGTYRPIEFKGTMCFDHCCRRQQIQAVKKIHLM